MRRKPYSSEPYRPSIGAVLRRIIRIPAAGDTVDTAEGVRIIVRRIGTRHVHTVYGPIEGDDLRQKAVFTFYEWTWQLRAALFMGKLVWVEAGK